MPGRQLLLGVATIRRAGTMAAQRQSGGSLGRRSNRLDHRELSYRRSVLVPTTGVVKRPWYYTMTGAVPRNYGRRQKVAFVLQFSDLGFWWEMFQATLSILACGVYVAQTCACAGGRWRRGGTGARESAGNVLASVVL